MKKQTGLDHKAIRRNLTAELAKIREDTMPLSERPMPTRKDLKRMAHDTKQDGWMNIIAQLSNVSGAGMSKFSGWANSQTGLGVDGIDSRGGARIEWNRLSWSDVESIYSGDDIAKKVCDLIPQEGLRKGFKLTGIATDDATEIMDRYEKLNGTANIFRSWSWSRLYGGVGLLVGVDDGEKDLSQPMNLAKVKQVTSLTPLHRWELYWDGPQVITIQQASISVYQSFITLSAKEQ